MALPANAEFDVIEVPPPDYNSVQLAQQFGTAPPPYDACVAQYARQQKLCLAASMYTLRIKVLLILAVIFGVLLLTTGIVLRTLQTLTPAGSNVIAWCLFGFGCLMLFLAACFCRLVVFRNRQLCCPCDSSEDTESTTASSNSASSAVSTSSANNFINRDYTNPPDTTNGPPPYHASAFVRQTTDIRNARLPRVPLATLSSHVQPVQVHFTGVRPLVRAANNLRTQAAVAPSLNGPNQTRAESAALPPRVPISTPLSVVTSLQARPHAAQARFAVNHGYVDETAQPSRVTNGANLARAELPSQEYIV